MQIYFFEISASLSVSSNLIPLLQNLRFDIFIVSVSFRLSILIHGPWEDKIIAGSSGFSEYNSKNGVLINFNYFIIMFSLYTPAFIFILVYGSAESTANWMLLSDSILDFKSY